MLKHLKESVRKKPYLFDLLKLIKRRTFAKPDPTYNFFDAFSKSHNHKVNFIQIGANDGLRNDPIREFVIRDRWKGIFVEPLPSVFCLLQHNYAHTSNSGLVFVNAAITTSDNNDLIFYTFDDPFLNRLSLAERLDYLQKSSFNREHVERHALKMNEGVEIKEIRISCMTMSSLLSRYWSVGEIDLLVIDAEGHEQSIIESINFNTLRPEAIFFESIHLGKGKDALFDFLNGNGYNISAIGVDAVAMLPNRRLRTTEITCRC